MIELARSLRRLRTKARKTQLEVAQACGFTSAQFVSNWERGISKPSGGCMVDLARVLNVHPKVIVNLIADADIRIIESERQHLLRIVKNA